MPTWKALCGGDATQRLAPGLGRGLWEFVPAAGLIKTEKPSPRTGILFLILVPGEVRAASVQGNSRNFFLGAET